MPVLLVNNLYGKDSVGGAEQVVRVRANRWVQEGHTVYVIATCKAGEERSKEIDGVQVQYIAPAGRRWFRELPTISFGERILWHIQNIFDVRTAKKILKYCEEWKIDTVETHNIMGVSMQLPRVLHRAGVVHHHYLHDVQLVEPSGIKPAAQSKDTLLQQVYSFVMRQLFQHVSVVYSPTNFLRKFYTSRDFFPTAEWRIEHEKLVTVDSSLTRGEHDTKVYLFVGYLGEHKGVDVLLDAWKNREQKKGVLRIVGDGHLRNFVEEQASEEASIDYLGKVPNDQIGQVYAQADVLVFPSQCIENRPNTIAEAMAYGLDIIAINTGGVAEMLDEYNKKQLLDISEPFVFS